MLAGLKSSLSCGPDGIPSLLLKRCSLSLSYPLALIFRQSFLECRVPSPWRLANVMPLFKGGLNSDPLNYRPISLTSSCCKVLEKIVVAEINDFLERNSLLSDSQFGFRSGVGVPEQLLLTYDFVTSHLDAEDCVDVVFFDYKKAFDLVNHNILLSKLRALGFGVALVAWVSDFLSDRRMRVVVHGSLSSYADVPSGVPQGSVVGPLLFLIYVNYVIADIMTYTLKAFFLRMI